MAELQTGSAAKPETPIDRTGIRVGPLWMNPGIRYQHVITLFFASFFGIASMSFINSSQPYILTEILNIPLNQQGTLSGRLTLVQEIILLCLLGPVGALSDKFGRRPIYAGAFFTMALAYFLYPLAGTVLMLFMFRLVFAAGASGNIVMLPAVANDYPQEVSRAKMIAACFIFNGLGLVLILSFLRGLPVRFSDMGLDGVTVGRYWLWTVSGICLFVGIVIALFLKPGAPRQLEKREPILSTFRLGLAAAKNPRIALAYAAAGVSRGDLSVMSVFFTLWLTQVGLAQGLETAEAAQRAFTFYITIQASAIPFAVIGGFILDRIDRLKGIAVAMTVATIGYTSLVVVGNPIGNEMYIAAVLVGAAEMFANLSATSLIGKEAPERGRGAVLGMWSWCGALGIAIVAVVGGYLFDNVTQRGPFAFVACANAALLIWSLILVFRSRMAGSAISESEA